MSVETFVAVLCLGAALLALWIIVRLPKIGPASLSRALIHLAAAVLIGLVTGPAIRGIAELSVPGAAFVGTFGIALPALTYMFLTAAWLMRLMAGYFQQPRF